MRSEIQKIAALLESDAVEKRIAAAIVLGELRAKAPEVTEGLGTLLETGVPVMQKHAMDALSRIGGAKKVLPKLFGLLVSNDGDVRRAAKEAIVSIGEDVVPKIRERMSSAEGDLRRALDAVLAELGGKDAFTTLLAGLASSEGESAKAAAFAVRQKVKTASAGERRSYLAETEKFLKAQAKGLGSVQAVAAAIKILGYLEDERALPTLLAYASEKKQPSTVRQEAIIALRFALSHSETAKERGKVVTALLDAAGDDDRAIAQVALHTLGSLELSAEHAKKLEKLVVHPDFERARFVIEQLGRQRGPDAAKVLTKVLREGDKRRAEVASAALAGNEDAAPLLARALLETNDADRGWMIRNVLRPTAKKISPALRKQLLETATGRLEEGVRGWEALLDVARDGDPESAAAALRALAHKLRKSNAEKCGAVLSILCRSDKATDEDRYARAAIELARSARDTRPAARAGDESLRQLGVLVDRGFDVAKALRGDRSIDLDHLYYVGFHFVEEGHPFGEELLKDVVKKGGQKKIAKMAKNKLSLDGSAQ